VHLTQSCLYIDPFRFRLNQQQTNMAEAVKDVVSQAVEGVKNLAVSAEQKAPKPKKEKKAKGGDGDGRPLMLDPVPAYIDHRVQIL
jgi:threonyl-tRNA synthetase